MVWLGLGLIISSFFMRFAGVTVLRVMCGTHWNRLFDPIPGREVSESTRPLFPGLGPADFDDLITERREVLRTLPGDLARLAWWRLGLRSWSKAAFWIGVMVLVSEVFL